MLKEYVQRYFIGKQFEWDSLKNLIFVCSFSTKLNDTLMWSHYTNKHKGFCIEYDLSKCSEKYINYFHPIIYSDKRFQIRNKNFWIERFISLHKEDGITIDEAKKIDDILIASMLKSSKWEYESEWRVTIPRNKIDDEFKGNTCLPIGCATAVYLGARMEMNQKNRIKEIAKSKQIEVHELKLSANSFDLIF